MAANVKAKVVQNGGWGAKVAFAKEPAAGLGVYCTHWVTLGTPLRLMAVLLENVIFGMVTMNTPLAAGLEPA